MTPEEQRILIAKACPTVIKYSTETWWYFFNGVWTPCRDNDPLSDLNAMHEAEKLLTWEQFGLFHRILCSISRARPDFKQRPDILETVRFCVSEATAAQRANAFIQAITEQTKKKL